MSNQIPQGGSYRTVRSANDGGEVHHIPTYSAYSQSGMLSKNDGPFGDKYNVGFQQAKDYSNEQVDPNIFTI